jgi:hypothetical protein
LPEEEGATGDVVPMPQQPNKSTPSPARKKEAEQ